MCNEYDHEWLSQVDNWNEEKAFYAMSAALVDVYETQIESDIDWSLFVDDIQESEEGMIWLGSVYGLSPSGKYYTFWASDNVDHVEAARDQAFFDALENVTEKYNMFVEYDADQIYVGLLD